MKRMLTVLVAMLVMAAMMVVMAMPVFAAPPGPGDPQCRGGDKNPHCPGEKHFRR